MWLSDIAIVPRDRMIARAAVRLEDGLIAEISERHRADGVRAFGHTLFPGFVDMHGDMIEQELEPRAPVVPDGMSS